MAAERVSLDIDASPEDVWRVTGERWNEIFRIVPSISDSRLIEGTNIEPGVARRCDLTEPTFGMEFVEERLIGWEPPRTFTYEMIDPPFPLQRLGNRWTIEANDPGTRLTMEPYAELRARAVTGWLEGFVLRRMVGSLESDQAEMRRSIEHAANAVE